MVNVRVADDHPIDLLRAEREWLAVARLFVGHALHQATFEYDLRLAGRQHIERSGHPFRRTEKLQLERHTASTGVHYR